MQQYVEKQQQGNSSSEVSRDSSKTIAATLAEAAQQSKSTSRKHKVGAIGQGFLALFASHLFLHRQSLVIAQMRSAQEG
jgi:hypothetical protein